MLSAIKILRQVYFKISKINLLLSEDIRIYTSVFILLYCSLNLFEVKKGVATVSRIYRNIVKRIKNEYKEIEAEEQAGSRVGISTLDVNQDFWQSAVGRSKLEKITIFLNILLYLQSVKCYIQQIE